MPHDLQLRCFFDIAFRNPDERSERFAKLLSEEVKRGTALQIHHVLQQYNLGIRMNVWNESASDKQVSLIVHPLLRLSIPPLATLLMLIFASRLSRGSDAVKTYGPISNRQ